MDTVRTFIVEDNPTIREALAGTLREVGRVDPVGQAESELDGAKVHASLPQWLKC